MGETPAPALLQDASLLWVINVVTFAVGRMIETTGNLSLRKTVGSGMSRRRVTLVVWHHVSPVIVMLAIVGRLFGSYVYGYSPTKFGPPESPLQVPPLPLFCEVTSVRQPRPTSSRAISQSAAEARSTLLTLTSVPSIATYLAKLGFATVGSSLIPVGHRSVFAPHETRVAILGDHHDEGVGQSASEAVG